MLDFLEKGIKSKRPAYDGVVMVCHVQERIPVLLKALKRLNLMDRFKQLVAGLGDTSTYLGKAHAKKIMSGGKMDLALSNVFRTVTGESMGSKYPTRSSGH